MTKLKGKPGCILCHGSGRYGEKEFPHTVNRMWKPCPKCQPERHKKWEKKRAEKDALKAQGG